MGKWRSPSGEQNLRVTCPTGKVEFKYFSSPEVGMHHGIKNVIKMQYMLGCLNEQEKGIRGSSKAPMSPSRNHDQIHL